MTRRIQILRAVAQNKDIGQRGLVELLGVDPRAHLLRLKAERLIRGVEVKGAMRYAVTQEGQRVLSALPSDGATLGLIETARRVMA
jgi:hypothetical protein